MGQSSMEYIKNANLGSREIKNMILKYLYTSDVNLNLKYENINNKRDLDNIRDNEYIICPRFSGTRSWIIFFHVNNNYYAVNFPKHSQRKKEDLKIHSIDISVAKEFYRGTIMEGIFFRMDDKKYLIIDEVYMLSGENQLLKSKDDRLNNLTQYIKTMINCNQNYFMYVSQYFHIDKKSLKELYEKIKADPKIQDLIFYPKIYGRKIYNYTIIDSDLVDNIIKIAQFRMEKTKKTDVYNLFSLSSDNKIDIAYVPDMETSKKCRQWFKYSKNKDVLVKCQMDMNKKKWIPMELIEKDLENNDLPDEEENEESEGTDENDIVEV